MIPRPRHRLPAAALAVALAAVWLHLATRVTGDASPDQAPRPELYIDAPVWEAFDPQGALLRRVTAGRLEKWPAESGARLFEPRLQLATDGDDGWRAQAQRGRLDETGGRLTLEEQVRLQRGRQAGALVVTTEALQIGDRGGLIETDRPVVLQSGNWHFTATGLRAEPGRQQLQLLENVRGIHE